MPNSAVELWRFDRFTLDVAGRVLTDTSGHEVALRRSEFELLLAFVRAPGRVLSRSDLLNAVAGRQSEPYDRSIDVLIGRLRRKVEVESKKPRLVLTVPGVGYKFAAHPVAAKAQQDETDEASVRWPPLPAVIGELSDDFCAEIRQSGRRELESCLDRLATQDLQFRSFPLDNKSLLKRALVRDAARGILRRMECAELHTRVGTALEQQYPEILAAAPELLAYHFTAAGQTERAIEYWLRAGKQALIQSRMAEAETMLRTAFMLLDAMPETIDRRARELELQVQIGRASFATHGISSTAAGVAWDRARELCGNLRSSPRLVPVMTGQWSHRHTRGELGTAQQLATEIRQIGEERADRFTGAMADRLSGQNSLYLGQFANARVLQERALAMYDPARRIVDAERTTVDELVVVLGHLGTTLSCLGFLDQARLRSDAAIAEARRLRHAHTLGSALVWASRARWVAPSEPGAVGDCASELLAVAGGEGFPFWHALGSIFRGWSLASLRRTDEGLRLLGNGLRALKNEGARASEPGVLTMMADACRIAKQSHRGLEHLAEAERTAEATGVNWFQAEALRLRGDLLLQTGDRSGAEASYGAATELARTQGAKLFELRSASSLARFWRDQGRRRQARDLLAPVYAWFTEGFAAPDLIEAKALLDELA